MSITDYADLTGIETQVLVMLKADVPRSATRIGFLLNLDHDVVALALDRLRERGLAITDLEDPRGLIRTYKGERALEFVGVVAL